MNKLLIAFLVSIPSIAMAQAEPDWFSNLPDPTPEVVPDPAIIDAPEKVNEGLTSILAEIRSVSESTKDTLNELLNAKDAAISAAKRANEAADRAESVVFSTSSPDLSDILARITELEARPSFTEAEIRSFAKDEAQKLIEVRVSKSDGTTETRRVTATRSVTLPGYAGTFEVGPGEVVTHVDNRPVSTSYQTSPTTFSATTSEFILQSSPTPTRSSRITFFPRLNSSRTCRMVNGIQICN